MVTAQASLGSITVGTRGMLFTIDGGYVAERTIDIGTDTRDVTIEQLVTDYEPSYIWAIGVDAGELLVRRREYDIQTSGVAFEPMFSLGPALDGAIEFDGEWHLAPQDGNALYRLSTFPNPYCFIIDNDHNLYVQRGSLTDTKKLLDVEVEKVSVCRGFKSMYFPEQDQGLIVLYIKNGQAWYTQYAYDEYTRTYMWFTPILITQVSGTIVDVHVHRLNDYRVGFLLTTTTVNYWLISARTYVGQSYKPEIAYVAPQTFSTVAIFQPPTLPETLNYTGTLSEDRKTITITFDKTIRFVGDYIDSYFTIPQALQFILKSIEVTDNTIVFTLEEPVYTAYSITMSPYSAWQYETQGQWTAFADRYILTYDPYTHLYNTYNEPAAQFHITQFDTSVVQRGIGAISHDDDDTASFEMTPTTVVQQLAIVERTNTDKEYVSFNVGTPTVTVQQILTGETPI